MKTRPFDSNRNDTIQNKQLNTIIFLGGNGMHYTTHFCSTNGFGPKGPLYWVLFGMAVLIAVTW